VPDRGARPVDFHDQRRHVRDASAGGDLGRHRDPFAGSLRYHLGLVTPNSEQCRIFVDGESYYWRDGEAVMFDETFIHWAENKSDVDRLILFCDVERPLTNRLVSKLNHWMERTFARASQTENVPGDKVGALTDLRFRVLLALSGQGIEAAQQVSVLRRQMAGSRRDSVLGFRRSLTSFRVPAPMLDLLLSPEA
jgi:aspartyl/asparaginyl beta-hydroxylase (cupin superfamily)